MLVKDRAQAAGIAGVQVSDQKFGKVYRGDTAATHPPQTDPLPEEGLADKATPTAPTDLAVAAHAPHRPLLG